MSKDSRQRSCVLCSSLDGKKLNTKKKGHKGYSAVFFIYKNIQQIYIMCVEVFVLLLTFWFIHRIEKRSADSLVRDLESRNKVTDFSKESFLCPRSCLEKRKTDMMICIYKNTFYIICNPPKKFF